MARFELKIDGMTCQSCVDTVTRALQQISGVNAIEVHLERNDALVQGEAQAVDRERVERALADKGYRLVDLKRTDLDPGEHEPRPLIVPKGGREAADKLLHSERLFRQSDDGESVSEHAVEIAIDGMRCAQCAASIEKRLRDEPGVREVQVSFAADYALVQTDPEKISPKRLLAAVESLGYTGSLTGSSRERRHYQRAQRWMIVALVLAAAQLALMVSAASEWIELALAALAVLGPGGSFLAGAWQGLKRGRTGMDFLVSLGASVALLTAVGSLLHWFPGMHSHAHAAVWLIAALRVGKFLEARIKGRAASTLLGLLEYLPGSACILERKAERIIRVDAVKENDRLIVRPSERIAADGVIVAGVSQVNESLVTGEAEPVAVKKGSFVRAGSINMGGQLEVEVRAAGRKSLIAQMAALMRKVVEKQAPVQRLADRIAAVFVPIVVLLAAASAGFWIAKGAGLPVIVSHVLATIVVACPCALSLAVPTALMAAAAQLMDEGVLIKDIAALERLSSVRSILFDKTGTLTRGEATVARVVSEPEDARMRSVLRAVALRSHHPASAALARHFGKEADGPPVLTDVQESAGEGVEARFEGMRVRLGRPGFAGGMEPDPEVNLCAAVDGRGVAAYVVEDEPRPGMKETMDALAAAGIEVAMVSGDRQARARALAEKVGVGTVYAEQSPVDKVQRVEERQKKGQRVMFVGDGFNDAAAIARADVGVAVAGGADLATSSGQLVLLRSNPRDLLNTFTLGRRTLTVIRQNLLLASLYNVVALPWAAGFMHALRFPELPPWSAGCMMAGSSLLVVINASRLQRKSRPKARR